MEILEDAGVAAEIELRSTPAVGMAATAYYAGLAGPDPDYGQRLARLECWERAAPMRTGARLARGAS
jgi:2,4-dichlorophenol 6-monooxygenase